MIDHPKSSLPKGLEEGSAIRNNGPRHFPTEVRPSEKASPATKTILHVNNDKSRFRYRYFHDDLLSSCESVGVPQISSIFDLKKKIQTPMN